MMYLMLANLYLCVFYGFYYFFLRRQTFFQWNRAYLLIGLLLSFTLPLTEHRELDHAIIYHDHLPIIQLGDSTPEQFVQATLAESSTSGKQYLPLAYALGCVIAALLVALHFVNTIRALRKRNPGQAYSFFGFVRIDHAVYGSHKIAYHEQVHVQQWHSLDIIVMQLVKILNWFNPVVYLYERALKLQHEYIADGKTAADDRMGYVELLVSRAMGASGPVLANSFWSDNMLKRRLSMLLRDRSPRRNGLRYVAFLPLVAGMAVFSIACNYQGKGGGDQHASDGVTTEADGAKAFKEELGANVAYRQEAIRNGTQGQLTFSYEKNGGRIEKIFFLNELGDGQEAEVMRALGRANVQRLAPAGKNTVSIIFRISGTERADTPMPLPVSDEYAALGTIVIVGYAPELPVPPATASPTPKNGDGGTKARKAQLSAAKGAAAATNRILPIGIKITLPVGKPAAVFKSVEIDPQPPGGMRTFMEYVRENYVYPEAAIEAAVNGTVQVSFVVERDGSLADMKIEKDLGYGTGEAAIRVLQSGGKWSPGVQKGRAVRVAYTLPIRLNPAFRLNLAPRLNLAL